MDAFGSNATATGGVFGRIDAVFGAIECQKCGTLHLHLQAFVQCYHQFTPLTELIRLDCEARLELLRRYSSYTAHVRRMVYCDPERWKEEQEDIEAEWPEYKTCNLMIGRPAYQTDSAMSARTWRATYLSNDVEALQKRKQHHVHLPAGPNGERLPLNHCRDPNDPTKCKSGFPRDKWLTDTPILLCPAEAQNRGMPCKGKRSMVGLLWGPCNDPNVNGTHPAMLASLRCNSDVQVPYRFPLLPELHDSTKACMATCCEQIPLWKLTKEAQTQQAAQAGYACDYQNKRLPVCVRECKEWMKAQASLIDDVMDKKPGYMGARLAKRIVTDCYARGVCRGAVECTNLTLHAGHADPTRAESIKTAPVTEMSLAFGLQLLEAAASEQPWPTESRSMHTDTRDYVHRKLIDCPPWTIYGSRGRASEVHMLSAYEFARHYHMKIAKHPVSLSGHQRQARNPGLYHATLTDTGIHKVTNKDTRLLPGFDYQIQEGGAESGWLPLGHGEHAQTYRHDWVVVPRKRPHVPVLFGAQGSQSEEEQAMKLLVLFFPWVNDVNDASPKVPFIGHLWPDTVTSWRQALRRRVFRDFFPTDEVKRLVLSFCFVYCLPRSLQLADGLAANSDNEHIEDLPVALCEDDLETATLTHVRGAKAVLKGRNNDAEASCFPGRFLSHTGLTTHFSDSNLMKVAPLTLWKLLLQDG